jgi:hypothetical protein
MPTGMVALLNNGVVEGWTRREWFDAGQAAITARLQRGTDDEHCGAEPRELDVPERGSTSFQEDVTGIPV